LCSLSFDLRLLESTKCIIEAANKRREKTKVRKETVIRRRRENTNVQTETVNRTKRENTKE
jgi:hypothetical protein